MDEIEILKNLLTKSDIPYYKNSILDGEQVIVLLPNGERIDAVWHSFSYGNEIGLLEIMGGLTEEESEGDSVLGWLTGSEVAKRFIYCYSHNTIYYREEED